MPITHKTTYVPVLNSSKPHHIARLLTLDIVWFVFSNVTLYSALVTGVVYVISCYIGPLYIGILLYVIETTNSFQCIVREKKCTICVESRLASCYIYIYMSQNKVAMDYSTYIQENNM